MSTIDSGHYVYVTGEGKVRFDDWFNKLNTVATLKVRTALARIETGNLVDVKPVGQGVSERCITFAQATHLFMNAVEIGEAISNRVEQDFDVACFYSAVDTQRTHTFLRGLMTIEAHGGIRCE